jgi:hypothetical protein
VVVESLVGVVVERMVEVHRALLFGPRPGVALRRE